MSSSSEKGGKSQFQRLQGASSEIVRVLSEMGYSSDDCMNLDGTAKRFATYLSEACLPWDMIVSKCASHISKRFPSSTDGMVFIGGTSVSSLCPHHLLPVTYSIDVAYLPSSSSVVGLSKIARVCDVLSRRPVLQEVLTRDIADVFCDGKVDGSTRPSVYTPPLECLSTNGSAVSVTGAHECMACRGVRQGSSRVRTVELRGLFFSNSLLRDEFYRTMALNKG